MSKVKWDVKRLEIKETVSPYVRSIKPRRRIFEIDFLRGTMIMGAIFDHFTWFVVIYVWTYWPLELIAPWIQDFARWCANVRITMESTWYTFGWAQWFLICGISNHFSQNNNKRARGTFIVFMIFYTLSAIFIQLTSHEVMMMFGIILGYAICIALFEFIRRLNPNIIARVLIMLFFIALSVTAWLFYPEFSVNPLRWLGISQRLGIQNDWFPLPVFIFAFAIGDLLGATIYKGRNDFFKLKDMYKVKIFKPITFCGQNSIWVFFYQALLIPFFFISVHLILQMV